ncbi:MAG: polyamine ABC transporter substrate-binding protein, partial [Cyanobacteria bacterium P01_H01_bin.119]
KFYSSTHHLQALVTEGVSLAAGWSTDILPLLRRYRNLRAVAPASGTLLSADVWVKPKIAELASEVAQPQDLKAPLADWLSFFWEPQVATQLTVTNPGASPLYSHLENPQLPEPLKTVSNLLPTAETYDQSEFLNPLSPATQAQALALWSKVSPAAPDR